MLIQSINPANGSMLRSYTTLTKKALTGKVHAAHEASWRFRRTSVERRAMWLKKLAGILEHEMEELATLLTSETGRTIVSARQEILDCAACCRYFAEHAAELPSDSTIPMELSSCEVRWQPQGVVLAIMPASNPLWQVFRLLAPALLAGNAVLLRQANAVCQSAMEIELLVMRAGFPREVVQTLLIGDRQLGPLLTEKQLSAVAVGEQVLSGRGVATRVKSLLHSATQERSSNPFVVMPSADLYAAIHAGVAARCAENGAANAGVARFIVHEAVYEEFEILFSAGMEDVKVGNPGKDDTIVGPLASASIVLELEAQIAAAVRDGGKLLTGGQRMVGVGNYFEPTVIAEIARGKKTRRTVFNGPVAMLFKVASVEDAIEVANEMPHSLGASVWTQAIEEQQDFAANLECESVFLNTAIVGDPLLALIGDRRSQSGSDLAAAMLREMMVARTIVLAEPMPQPSMDLDLTLEDVMPAYVAESRVEPVEERVVRSFAAVLSEANKTSEGKHVNEEAEVELDFAVGVMDLFDADEEWAPTVALRAPEETGRDEGVADVHPLAAPVLAEAVCETVEVPAIAEVLAEVGLAAVITAGKPLVKHAARRKMVMPGMMKQLVDQVIATNRKVQPAIAKAMRTNTVTNVKAKTVKSLTTLPEAVAAPAATVLEPELCAAGAASSRNAMDFQTMFEKALSSRPGS